MTAPVAVVDEFREDPAYEARLRAQVREIIAQSFSPPPKLTVSEWADEYRVLSPEASSEPGKWSTARVEPSRGIMDAFADPEIEIITCMVAAQTVKTEVINNVAGFHVHLDPCPMLILQPTLQMAEAYSKDRLAPMIRDTPPLAAKLGNSARDSAKPLEAYNRIERLLDGPYIELFARHARAGWHQWGNEVGKTGGTPNLFHLPGHPARAANDNSLFGAAL